MSSNQINFLALIKVSERKKKSYKGFNSRKKTSFNKNSKNYKKKYRGQGRVK